MLEGAARLDRDVVFVITPREERPAFTLHAPAAPMGGGGAASAPAGNAATVVMASFVPPPAAQRARIALKLLVDCSGSMGGDSIASARAALHGVVHALTDADCVSFSRFGSTVRHALAPAACTTATRSALHEQIDATDATHAGLHCERPVGGARLHGHGRGDGRRHAAA